MVGDHKNGENALARTHARNTVRRTVMTDKRAHRTLNFISHVVVHLAVCCKRRVVQVLGKE